MVKLQVILLVAIICVTCGSARPTRENENSRKLSQHDRSSTAKRHADVNVSTELAKLYRDRRRMGMLMKLMNSAGSNGQNFSAEIYPRSEHIPDHSETSQRLLSHLNGEARDAGLRVRYANHHPVTAPQHIQDLTRKADALRQQAAMARTCLDLQKTLLKMPSLRIKISCSSDVPERTPQNPIAPQYTSGNPAGLVNYRYQPQPARRVYWSGQHRNTGLNGVNLNRRHAGRSRQNQG